MFVCWFLSMFSGSAGGEDIPGSAAGAAPAFLPPLAGHTEQNSAVTPRRSPSLHSSHPPSSFPRSEAAGRSVKRNPLPLICRTVLPTNGEETSRFHHPALFTSLFYLFCFFWRGWRKKREDETPGFWRWRGHLQKQIVVLVWLVLFLFLLKRLN